MNRRDVVYDHIRQTVIKTNKHLRKDDVKLMYDFTLCYRIVNFEPIMDILTPN